MSSTQIYISPQPINTNQDQTQNSSYKPDNNIIKIQENTIYNDNLTEPGYQIQRIILLEQNVQNEPIEYNANYILIAILLGGFGTILISNYYLPPEKKQKYFWIGIWQILLFPFLYIGYIWAIISACNGYP